MTGTVDAVLYSGDEDVRTMQTSLVGDALQFDWIVGMVIGKTPAEDNFDAKGGQCSPKAFRIADATESPDPTTFHTGDDLTIAVIVPRAQEQARAEGRSVWVPFLEPATDSLETMQLLGAGNNKGVRARKTFQRLTEAAERNHFFSAERIQAVNDNDVEIAFQPRVLKAIIEQEHAG